MVDWSKVDYFSSDEFDSPDDVGSGEKMNAEFVYLLDNIRRVLGEPIQINSGIRTPEHNKRVGGVSNSAHLRGLAADIHCPNLGYMERIVTIARNLGVKRIGQYFTENGNYFVHFDIDPTKSHQGGWAFNQGAKTSNYV